MLRNHMYTGSPEQKLRDIDLELRQTVKRVNGVVPDRYGNIEIELAGGGSTGKANVYVIETAKWGISPGIPAKPYKTTDYNRANNNIKGINDALVWAKNNNYNYVVLPFGSYTICYPNPVITQPNMVIDFGFSTLKVIFDSDVRSPFDLTGKPIYEFKGDSILCTTPNTKIINLTLVGDRVDRSWSKEEEKTMESTNGIKFGAGANNCRVSGCDLSYYMGDAIALYYSPYTYFDTGVTEFGTLNSNGEPVASASNKTVRSTKFSPIPSGITAFTMIGLGYRPDTSIPSGSYDVYFYDKNNVFVSFRKNIRTRDPVQVPSKAVKLKLVWEGNGTVDDDCVAQGNPPYWAILIEKGLADNIVVEYNEIHRNHRGGIFLGTNNVTIKNNFFHDTGYQGDKDLDGIPTFTDFTRYAINTEDNIGHNCKIVDNVFENTRMAVALRGEFNMVSGNEFRNCTYGVILYHLKHSIVRDNYFYFSSIGCYEYENLDRDWLIDNNIFVGGGINLTGSGVVASVSSNSFYGASFISTIHLLNCKSNTFNNATYMVEEPDTILDGCSFVNNSTIRIINKATELDNIIRCKFIDSFIYGQNSVKITVRDSYFKESSYIYSSGKMTYAFVNCKVNNKKTSLIKSNSPIDLGSVYHTLEVVGCSVSLGDNAILNSMSWGDLIIRNSDITFVLTKNLTKALVDFFGDVEGKIEIRDTAITAKNFTASQSINLAKEVVFANTKFTNFSLTDPSVEIQVGYILTAGTTTARPKVAPVGHMYFDTTLNKPIWRNATNNGWVDNTGTPVT
ncbi:UNVERIFIED_ORG: hypothetical protein Xoosp15_125 [Xanthomonas phage Xoo-sp15]